MKAYERRKSAGLCVRCERPTNGVTKCGDCYALQKTYERKDVSVHKSDEATKKIVDTLRKYGCSVEYIGSPFGVAGIPDLLVGRKGITHLLEVKTPPKAKNGRIVDVDLSEAQINWHLSWNGRTVSIVTNEEEALVAVGVVK